MYVRGIVVGAKIEYAAGWIICNYPNMFENVQEKLSLYLEDKRKVCTFVAMKQTLLTILLLLASCLACRAEDEIVSYKLTSENGLPDNNIREIGQDSLYGYIYMKGRHATYRYDGYHFRELTDEEAQRIIWHKMSQGNRPGDVFRDNLGNRLELKSNGDLLYTDRKSGEDITIHVIDPVRYQLTQRMKCNVITDREGRIWVATNSIGMLVYDKRTGQTHRITKDAPERLINSNYIVSMYYDREGNIWVATENHGVAQLKARDKHYRVITFNDSNDEMENKIRMLQRLDDGRILIADMIGTLRMSTDELQTIQTLSYHGDNYIAACQDMEGRLWLGSRLHGVNVNGKNYGDGRTDCIIKDHKGRMWTCGLKNGVRQVSLTEGQLKERRFMEDIPDLNARVMMTDHRGDIWLGTKQGLYVFNPDELLTNGKSYKKMGDWPVVCLCETKAHTLWVGTNGKGAFYGDNRQKRPSDFKGLTTLDGLAHNAVQLIAEDDDENLYVGTEDGCSFVDVGTHQMLHLYFHDHLLRNTTNERCVVRLKDGSMAFGTLEGIIVIRERIPAPCPSRSLLMTGFYVNGQPLEEVAPYKGDISELREVTLAHYQNFIEMSFSNMNFGENRQTTLLCFLEGYDREWQSLDNGNTVSYKKLSAGKYTLHVRSKETSVAADSKELMLRIVVRPVWWASWWAIVIYLLTGTAVVYLLFRYFRDRYRLHRDIEVERQLTDYKLRFFTNISHEFRTPLTLIQGAMERMRDAQEIPGNMRQPLSNMQRSVERMIRLVNQLLEFRRMQDNKLSLALQETDIVAFLRDIYMNFHDIAENRHISYTFGTTDRTRMVYVDRGHIDKIVYNLLSNAFKYTPKGGSVAINLRFDDLQFTISVTDTGVGISKEKQSELFSRFAIGKVKAGSIGIGLNLTQELVHVHKGSIAYQENTPEGSVFTVKLPLDKAVYKAEDFMVENTPLTTEEKEEGKVPDGNYREIMPEPMNDRRVLVVEDNIDVAEMLSHELGRYFQISIANDGQEALEMLQQADTTTDLVVSDVMMPRMNGFELTKAIRADEKLRHLPIVLLTALSSEDKQERGMNVGADAYIAKPFSLRLLVAQCCSLLNQRERLKTAYATLPQQKEAAVPEIIKEERDRKFIDRLDIYINNHIADTELTVDTMAEHFNMGRTSFYNKVRTLTGVTPNEYLKDIRLSRAAQLLKGEDVNVSEACYRVGIGNPQYFATSFKKKYGISPKEYQKGK